MIIKMEQKMSNKGFTLIEIMVTITIFSLIFGMISGLFASTLRAQRRSLVSQELLAQTSYAVEYMSRQLRMASNDPKAVDDCTATANSYKTLTPPTGVQFLNYQKCCIKFYVTDSPDNRLRQEILASPPCSVEGLGSAYLTSADFEVEEFNVNLAGGPGTNQQARVTLFLKIRGKGEKAEEQPVEKIQNTISQRNLNIE